MNRNMTTSPTINHHAVMSSFITPRHGREWKGNQRKGKVPGTGAGAGGDDDPNPETLD